MEQSLSEPSKLGIEKNINSTLELHNNSLQKCLDNYEGAIRLSQDETLKAQREARSVKRQLDILIHLVKHNVKNPDTILRHLDR